MLAMMLIATAPIMAFANSNYRVEEGYIVNSENNKVANALIDIEGKKYMTAETGAFKKGWIEKNDKWYYAGDDGTLVKGFITIAGKTFYLNENSYELQEGIIQTEAGMSYVQESGELISGWKKIGQDWYYFDIQSLGDVTINIARVGWLESNGLWYYFYPDGKMARNAYVYGYFFDSHGVCRY